MELAANPKRLGAQLGFLGVLHTWTQTLLHHPHVHYVVVGGGPSLDESRWLCCRRDYFLPFAVLRKKYKGRFLDLLKKAHAAGKLAFYGRLQDLRQRKAFLRYLKEPYRKKWVVYAKRPFGGPEQVLKYLARYTHRVAISNGRLVSAADGMVSFRWRDRQRGYQRRVMSLEALEFLRRFLLHVLPHRFVRVRYYGFLANCQRREKLKLCRELLQVSVVRWDDAEGRAHSSGARSGVVGHRGLGRDGP